MKVTTRAIFSLSILILLASIAAPSAATVYYVSTTGSDGAAGTSPAAAWRTISYAAAQAQAGDTVYIQAGNYGSEVVVMSQSGTSTAPIVFEGYTTSPGDVLPPASFNIHQAGGLPEPVLDATEMPLIQGGSATIDLSSRAWVEVRNIQIDGGAGIYMNGADQITIDNYRANGCNRAVELFLSTHVSVTNSQVKNSSIYSYHLRGTSDSLVENSTSHGLSIDPDYHFRICRCAATTSGRPVRPATDRTWAARVVPPRASIAALWRAIPTAP